MSEMEVKEKLKNAIRLAIEEGFTTFISGMARGVDMWAAEIVLDIREEYRGIKLMCVSPFEGFEKQWSFEEKYRYNSIMEEADCVKFVCKHYSKGCFQIRNKYMVDNCARVISAYNGEKGGTQNTIMYAKHEGVECVNILDVKI